MKRTILIIIVAVLSLPWSGTAEMKSANLRFDVTFPDSVSEDLTTQQVFGIDVDAWKPGEAKTVDQGAFGYPVRSLSEIKPGEYWVQALLHRYETFKRSDGHTVKLPMDRGEGQQWS